jgi:hypothetical protein
MAGELMALRALDQGAARRVRSLCDAIVPGSATVGPEIYVDALLARMEERDRRAALSDLDAVATALEQGELEAVADTPAFGRARAFAIEAYYSDFVAPGAAGPGAWERIGFDFPLANRVRKNWSFMGIDDE